MHLTSSPVDWYAARAAGVVAYLLLSAVVVLGLTMARKAHLRRWPRFAIEDIHRFGGLLVGLFVGIHVVTVAIDSWLPFSVGAIIVPFLSRYRPLWVGLGIVAAELLLALAVTNHYRRRLPYRFWRRAHYLNFAVWGGATLHGIGSGTDRSSPWLLALYAAAVAAVGASLAWRLLVRREPRLLPRTAAVVAVAFAAVIVVLGGAAFRFQPKPWNASRFQESLTGRILQTNGFTRGIVSMAGEGNGTQRVLVRADLLVDTRRILQTSFQMEYLPSGELCRGEVTQTQSFGFSAICHLPGGQRRYVTTTWNTDGTSQIADGKIKVHA